MILESSDKIVEFVNSYKKSLKVKVIKSKFSKIKNWKINDYEIAHKSGGFFFCNWT